ncbi:hypothetical protein VNO77_20194 [Canavalia gladiata]|uniref:Uncharacterized protein n=1 Tax=Canavalia gladiata TaxID=3824 RepID=A0AAN9LP07_CANGL
MRREIVLFLSTDVRSLDLDGDEQQSHQTVDGLLHALGLQKYAILFKGEKAWSSTHKNNAFDFECGGGFSDKREKGEGKPIGYTGINEK